MLSIIISSCLGLSSTVGLSGGPTGGVKRVECSRFRVGGDGYESLMDENEDGEDARGGDGDGQVKESFNVVFEIVFGGLEGVWVAKDLSLAGAVDAEGEDDAGARDGGDEEGHGEDWKKKFLELQKRLLDSQERERNLREKVLEAVL